MDNARGMNVDVAQPQLAHHDSRLLDLAFALDTTSSMSPYIHSACSNIRHIVEDIVAKESSDLRLALVEYRDHPPEESTYVTQVHDFTPSIVTMKNWLEASKAVGGGDAPEAVADALHDVLKLSWRPEATKICVLISDAPPHGLNPQGGDMFPEGCPAGHDPVDLARKLAEKGVTLYVAGCEPALTPYKEFFAALAYITGGQYVPLSAAGALTAVIVGGAQEEMSLEQWMEQVNQLVMQEVQQQGEENVSHDYLSHQVMDRLSHAGARSKQLHMNKTALQSASAEAVALSNCADMAAMRSKFKASAPPPAAKFRAGTRSRAAAAPPMASAPLVLNAPMGGTPMFGAPPEVNASMGGAPMFGAPPEVNASVGRASIFGAASKAPMPKASAMDCYETGEGEIQMQQAQRMVQKSLMRNKITLPKK